MFFISYCRGTDYASAVKLGESLRSQGVASNEIWFDEHSIAPGNDLRNHILEGIQSCRYFVPIISKAADALDEKYFRREWHEAVERGKGIQGRTFIFPVIVDEAFKLEDYQCIPLEFDGDGNAFVCCRPVHLLSSYVALFYTETAFGWGS